MEDLDTLSFKTSAGKEVSLKEYRGKSLLIINTATQCGLTPQFSGLEKIHQKYKDRGLVVLGFPCNQFGGQEPLNNDEMVSACEINHGVTFQLTEKVEVNGPNTHEVFQWLKKKSRGFFGSKIKWNFTKFLVDADHKKVWRFGPTMAPEKVGRKVEEIIS